MCNRQVSYGYQIKDGKYEIVEEEAKIVHQIFNDYIHGKNMTQIANELNEKQIYFYQNDVNWNKNKIDRIIKNTKYLGDEKYNSIIQKEVFNLANQLKSQKAHKKAEISVVMDYIKTITYCSTCGRLLIRKVESGKKERWYCKNGCLMKKPIVDITIEDGIKQVMSKIDLSLDGKSISEEPTYQQTSEIMRYKNEIHRVLNEPNVSYQVIKQMILKMASLKFEASKENNLKFYTQNILEETKNIMKQEKLSIDYLKSNINKITINSNLIFQVQFKNGMEITN